MVDDVGLEEKGKKLNTLPLYLGAVVLSNSKRFMNNIIQAIKRFCTNDLYYTDTDSFYSQIKHWDKLDKAALVGKNFSSGKIDYKEGGVFYGFFLAPKIK